MTPETLSAAAAIVLSLVFSYMPGLAGKWALLASEQKKLIMLGLTVLVGIGAYGLACAGILTQLTGVAMACDQETALGLARSIVMAVIANQAAYQISPESQTVKTAKAIRDGELPLGRG